MESETIGASRKRMKSAMEDKEDDVKGAMVHTGEEGTEMNIAGSEDAELGVTRILEKIEHFTQMVSGLLESGKAVLKELSDEFEEQMILIHKEQVEKWQDEIKELRLLDASNEEVNALLHDARRLVQNTDP